MLEDKKEIGRSKKKREAEIFAARRMVDDNYLTGNNYCPPTNSVPATNSGTKPCRKRRQLKQVDVWARKKETERSEVESYDAEDQTVKVAGNTPEEYAETEGSIEDELFDDITG